MLTKVPRSRVEKEFQALGFSLGATVEFDLETIETDIA
jgi:hypothetical protein